MTLGYEGAGRSSVAYASGVGLASLLAGPICLTIVIFPFVWSDTDAVAALFGTVAAYLLSVPFGAVLSLLPNVVGTSLLASLGRRYLIARHPLVWLFAGAAFGAAIGFAYDAALYPTLTMTLVGSCCAGLCRRGTQWHDEPAPPG